MTIHCLVCGKGLEVEEGNFGFQAIADAIAGGWILRLVGEFPYELEMYCGEDCEKGERLKHEQAR